MSKRTTATFFTTFLLFSTICTCASAAYTYRVEVNDAFVWKVTSEQGLVLYLKGTVIDVGGGDIYIEQLVYDPVTDSIMNETFFTTNIVENLITSIEGMDTIASNPSYNPRFINKTYAGKPVTCLGFQPDPVNYGFVDNATGVICEMKYDEGDTSITVFIISWTDEDLHSYKQFSFFSLDVLFWILIIGAPLILLLAVLVNKNKKPKRRNQARSRSRK